jgi:TPR repeat protein
LRNVIHTALLLALLTGVTVALADQKSEALKLCTERITSQNWYGAAEGCMTAAKRGHAVAQYHLGYLFEYGYGFEQSYTKAAHWWTMAANQGHAKAKDALSVYYEAGVGVQQDMDKAFRLVKEAAMTGLHTAQTRLGRFYLDGEVIRKDKTEAYLWLFISKENGNTKANELLEGTQWNMSPTKTRIVEQAAARCIASDYHRCGTQID